MSILRKMANFVCALARRGAQSIALPQHLIGSAEEARAQWLRLQNLRVSDERLWIHSAQRSFQGNLVADTSDFIQPEFTIQPSEISSLLPPLPIVVTWNLAANQQPKQLERTELVPSGERLRIKASRVPVREPELFPGPGVYSVFCTVAGRPLVGFRFRILGRTEWLQQVRVGKIELKAQTPAGQAKLENQALHWGKHVAFQPTVYLGTAVPAPNSPVCCTVRLVQGSIVLRSESFLVRFSDPVHRLDLESFNFLQLPESFQQKRVRLSLLIHVEEELKADWPIVILPADRVTDFEGQLKHNPGELALEEDPCNEILDGLLTRPKRSRKFFA